MTATDPAPELDHRFSDPAARPRPWHDVQRVLQDNEMFWLATVRADGRPHSVPLPAIWLEQTLYFCTGSAEQKARNLAHSPHCVLSTGTATMNAGLDVAVEGPARRVADEGLLDRLAERWRTKLNWYFDVVPGGFIHPAAPPETQLKPVLVFGVQPQKVLAFSKGEPFSQTRFLLD
ncbi:MAG TPA: pyridoxamine 5'-phosphate oxidase family protein [Beutenbergiaceae bacterium]|nr:pyridoxamine 5'-phosphate oxidase family protein [Beutenbergiaceae bacterium]